jgi:hypothetical protein
MNQNKIQVVKELRMSMQAQDEYVDALPQVLQEAVLDNEYANLQRVQREVLMQALFQEHYEDVCWFLYEFTPGKSAGPHLVLADGTEHTFRNDNDYYTYLETLGTKTPDPCPGCQPGQVCKRMDCGRLVIGYNH